MGKGIHKPHRLLHVIDFVGGARVVRLGRDFGKLLVIGEQEVVVLLTSMHRPIGPDLGESRLD